MPVHLTMEQRFAHGRSILGQKVEPGGLICAWGAKKCIKNSKIDAMNKPVDAPDIQPLTDFLGQYITDNRKATIERVLDMRTP